MDIGEEPPTTPTSRKSFASRLVELSTPMLSSSIHLQGEYALTGITTAHCNCSRFHLWSRPLAYDWMLPQPCACKREVSPTSPMFSITLAISWSNHPSLHYFGNRLYQPPSTSPLRQLSVATIGSSTTQVIGQAQILLARLSVTRVQ